MTITKITMGIMTSHRTVRGEILIVKCPVFSGRTDEAI